VSADIRRTPMLSTSILSRPKGPRELLTILAIVCAAITGETECEGEKLQLERTILISDILT
jgi:hypothetical protein